MILTIEIIIGNTTKRLNNMNQEIFSKSAYFKNQLNISALDT